MVGAVAWIEIPMISPPHLRNTVSVPSSIEASGCSLSLTHCTCVVSALTYEPYVVLVQPDPLSTSNADTTQCPPLVPYFPIVIADEMVRPVVPAKTESSLMRMVFPGP